MRGFIAPEDSGAPSVVVVGEGLIGREVSERVRRRGHRNEWFRATDWGDPDSLARDLAEALDESIVRAPIEIVWSAGQAGMSLEHLDLDEHLASFRRQVGGLVAVASDHAPVRLHYVSSAGALGPPGGTTRFEVGDSPYARLKAGEEAALASLGDNAVVYRVSSVYGTPRPGARCGVIGFLVENALRGRETLLFARTTTMRNYVHATDVAEAIIRNMDRADNDPVLLAAPRSHPMNEVVAEVGRTTRRPVPICIRPPSNDHDMVFDPRQVSDLLPDRSLSSGIRLVYDGILAR